MIANKTTNKTGKDWKGWFKKVFCEDQYHLGSIDLTNPTKNHYTIGLFPVTRVHGEKAEGKIRTIGIYPKFYADSGMNIKDNSTCGFILNNNFYGDNCTVEKSMSTGVFGAYNFYGDNCTVEKSRAIGMGASNSYGNKCKVGESVAIGTGTVNFYESNCTVEKSRAIGAVNVNDYGENCKIKESSKSIGFLNSHKRNEEIKSGLLERSVIGKD